MSRSSPKPTTIIQLTVLAAFLAAIWIPQTMATETPPPLPPAAEATEPPPLPPAAGGATEPPPLPPQKAIFVVIDGERRGPLSEGDLTKLMRDGAVNANTQLWREGMAEWQPIAELADYADLIAQNTAVPQPPALPKAAPYYALIDGRQQGPFSAQQLMDMGQRGQINGATMVWNAEMTGWQPASSVPHLAAAFPAAPPPPPAPPKVGGNIPGGLAPGGNGYGGQRFSVRSYCSITNRQGVGSGATLEEAKQKAIQACVAAGGLPNCCPHNLSIVR